MLGIWRWFLMLMCGVLVGCSTSQKPLPVIWQQYKRAYVSDGRVKDTANSNVSHSEGQGYAMLLAVAYDDEATFMALWQWTQSHLQVRQDKLFSWRWQAPEPHITDTNNASDGDLLVAWALLRASQQWQKPELQAQALAILQDVKHLLIRPSAYGQVLLPAAFGFEKPEGLVLNPSYWVYPALKEIAVLDQDPVWPELQQSGLRVLAAWQRAGHPYPPDWLVLQAPQGVVSAPTLTDKSARFGFEAIRIPLYLCWIKAAQQESLSALTQAWTTNEQPPAWMDQAGTADYPLSVGGMTIRWLLLSQRGLSVAKPREQLPRGTDYYAGSLMLLALLAATENR